MSVGLCAQGIDVPGSGVRLSGGSDLKWVGLVVGAAVSYIFLCSAGIGVSKWRFIPFLHNSSDTHSSL